jgi:hypothetical protein
MQPIRGPGSPSRRPVIAAPSKIFILAFVLGVLLGGPANAQRFSGRHAGFAPHAGFFHHPGFVHPGFFPHRPFVANRFFFGGVFVAPPVYGYPYYPYYYPPYPPYPYAPYPY